MLGEWILKLKNMVEHSSTLYFNNCKNVKNYVMDYNYNLSFKSHIVQIIISFFYEQQKIKFKIKFK